jgi:quercetin dioxygenase-like cupin family protein
MSANTRALLLARRRAPSLPSAIGGQGSVRRTMTGGRAEATFSAGGEGERLWFLGTLATIRISGEAVDGRFALIEFLFPRHASPPRHTHPQDESYIVLAGELSVEAGEQRFSLRPGGTAAVPMGVPHTFRVDSETARVLVLSTPSGLERFVRESSVPATGPTLPPDGTERPSPEKLSRIFEAHGQVNVGPPLGPED